MKESVLVRKILQNLNQIPNCKAIKIHGSPYIEAGTPDILGCYHGRMFCLEVKTSAGVVSPIQNHRIVEWSTAGAVVHVIRDYAHVDIILKQVISRRRSEDVPVP